MNQLVLYNCKDLDDIEILEAMQQVKNVALAYESLRALLGENIIALPVALDREWMYWCAEVHEINNTMYYGTCVTKFHSANAGDVVNIEARLALKARNLVVKAITRILKEDRATINDQVEKSFSKHSRGGAPKDAHKWLEDCLGYLKVGMAK